MNEHQGKDLLIDVMQDELARLRRVEEAARAVLESVAEADRDAFTCYTVVNPYRVAKLREALEAKK